MEFFKYQGTGNDFVMIDDRVRPGRNKSFPAGNQALIAQICHRRFGIGADGLILLQNDDDYDFRMVYFNADGAEGSMCGNGGRCIVRFSHDLGLFTDKTRFRAVDGEHLAEVHGDEIFLKMSDVAGIEDRSGMSFLHTGSPHVVRFVTDLDDTDAVNVVADGRKVRHDDRFSPGGTNVNFVQILDGNTLYVRTYERGVEDETYSCGTGVTAVALVAYQQEGIHSPTVIKTLGGNLRVSFNPLPNGAFDNIYLIGPARRVFAGEML
jgi:diaminopimelate epimerase